MPSRSAAHALVKRVPRRRRGEKEGARILQGSAKPLDRPGYFVAPTLFDAVTPQMTIAREEIFGPVLGVITANSVEEALRIAVDTDYGLHATIFTKDIDRALFVARRLPCGTVSINKFTEGDVKTLAAIAAPAPSPATTAPRR